jgi:hypothetical protein
MGAATALPVPSDRSPSTAMASAMVRVFCGGKPAEPKRSTLPDTGFRRSRFTRDTQTRYTGIPGDPTLNVVDHHAVELARGRWGLSGLE